MHYFHPRFSLGLALVLVLAAAGCDRNGGDTANNGVRQTHYPGEVTAGGGTSGEVMARTATVASPTGNQSGAAGVPQTPGSNPGGPQLPASTTAAGGAPGSETIRGQSSSGGVKGTPSIPEGAGGNVSGAQMGGTTPGAAASKATPEPNHDAAQAPGGKGK